PKRQDARETSIGFVLVACVALFVVEETPQLMRRGSSLVTIIVQEVLTTVLFAVKLINTKEVLRHVMEPGATSESECNN
ncbi:unnamed protein product, partial [Allacma fusca]